MNDSRRPILVVRSLRVEVKSKHLEICHWHDHELSVYPGTVTAIFGSSGGGKSLALECILGMSNPSLLVEGMIELPHENMTLSMGHQKKVAKMWRTACTSAIASFNRNYQPEQFLVSEYLTMNSAVPASALYRSFLTLWHLIAMPANPSDGDLNIWSRRLCDLSSYERRLVSIIACLQTPIHDDGSKPRIIFLDEPTSGLPVHWSMRLLNVTSSIMAQSGWAALVILHQPTRGQISTLSSMYYVHHGAIVELSTKEAVDMVDGEGGGCQDSTPSTAGEPSMPAEYKSTGFRFHSDIRIWICSFFRNRKSFIPTNIICPLILSIVFFFAFIGSNSQLSDVQPVNLVAISTIHKVDQQLKSFIDDDDDIEIGTISNTWANFLMQGAVGARTSLEDIPLFPTKRTSNTPKHPDAHEAVWRGINQLLPPEGPLLGACLAPFYQWKHRFGYACEECPKTWSFSNLGLNYYFSVDSCHFMPADHIIHLALTSYFTFDTLMHGNLSKYGPLSHANASLHQLLYKQCQPNNSSLVYWACIALHLEEVSRTVDPILHCVMNKPLLPQTVSPEPDGYELIYPTNTNQINSRAVLFMWLEGLLASAKGIFLLSTCIFMAPCVIGFITYFAMCLLYPSIPFLNFLRFTGARRTRDILFILLAACCIVYSALGIMYTTFVLLPLKPLLQATSISNSKWTTNNVVMYLLSNLLVIFVFIFFLISYAMLCVVGSLAGLETDLSHALMIYLMPLMLSVVFCGFVVRPHDLNVIGNFFGNLTFYRLPYYAFLRIAIPQGFMFGTIPSEVASAVAGIPTEVASITTPILSICAFSMIILAGAAILANRHAARLKGFFEGGYN